MSESVLAASGFSLVSLWFQAEKGTLSPLEFLSFANTIQADLPTCDFNSLCFVDDSERLKALKCTKSDFFLLVLGSNGGHYVQSLKFSLSCFKIHFFAKVNIYQCVFFHSL